MLGSSAWMNHIPYSWENYRAILGADDELSPQSTQSVLFVEKNVPGQAQCWEIQLEKSEQSQITSGPASATDNHVKGNQPQQFFPIRMQRKNISYTPCWIQKEGEQKILKVLILKESLIYIYNEQEPCVSPMILL